MIELLKKKITNKSNEQAKSDFISSINYLYSVHKLKIEEKENNVPTLLKLLDVIEKKGRYWENVKINKDKTTCRYDEENLSYKIDVYINKKNGTLEELPVSIIVKNNTGCYSYISCEEFINIFNYAFGEESNKNIVATIKSKITATGYSLPAN